MAKIRFTGTRHGMLDEQKEAFESLIKSKEVEDTDIIRYDRKK